MTMKKFRSIAITGASRGLGAALAIESARQSSSSAKNEKASGLSLYLAARQLDKLEAVATTCRALGADVYVTSLDVTDRKACEKWMGYIDAQNKGLDLVIANAGISGGTGRANEVAEQSATLMPENIDAIDQIFAVNWQGVLNTIHPAIELIGKNATSEHRGGVAVLSSIAGFRGMPGAPAYCASKSAVKSYGESLRAVLDPHHIDMSVICPGFVKSDMTDANDFKMPFLMSAERAAKIMIKALQKGKGRIAFPLPMVFGAWLMNALPNGVVHLLTKKTPSKPSL